MPKKRKKDKIAADIRHQKQAEKMASYSFVKPPTDRSTTEPDTSKPSVTTSDEKVTGTRRNIIPDPDNRHLRKDLFKIVIFTVFALSFQGVLYFFLRG